MIRTFVVSLLLALLYSAGASAQHFGRNKVEYVDFDFRILATEHFDVYYYAREERAARIAAQLAERWYARFSTLLNHQFVTRQPLVLYGSQAEFAQTNVISGLLPDSVGGVTDAARRRITMPFAPTMAETNRVLGHEIVHAFQFDIARRIGGDTGQPLWFIEGMAEYLSRGSLDEDSSLWLRDAVLNDHLPKTQSEAARELSPYLYGHAFWSYLGGRFGDQIVEKALKPGRKQRRLADRMRFATGGELDALFGEWRLHAGRTYGARTEGAERLKPWTRDHMQLGPALSPDGRQAVFFSERDRLSMDLFLVDVATGDVIRKLATTAASAKFDSLQPLRSSGAWSADGQWFAFAAVRRGSAALMLLDMTGRGRDREVVFDGLGQVLTPAWSPDGRSIAFSALTGGMTDLYVCDVTSGTVRQITDDAFADLQPAWSHDGRTIAFATERFSSDLDRLVFGPPGLALLDVRSEAVSELPVAAGAAALNPQWSSDDREIYFVGNPNGTKNIFRTTVDASAIHQITHVDTGVSGITPTSPALSLSANGETLAFTVYERGRPRMIVQSERKATAGAPQLNAGDIASVEHPAGAIDGYLADALTGLPGADAIASRAYRPRMSLEGVGQPYLSSGGGAFGTFVRGGGALMFGDMLGERRLGAAIQIGNRLRDAAFTVRYLNQEKRWNWGVIGDLQPTVARYRRWEAIEHEGQPALLKQADYMQRMQFRAAAVVAYPFNRGLRMEFTGGVRHANYHRDLRSQVADIDSGKVLATGQVESSGGQPTTVGEVSAALVHDTTVFGPNGPLLGSRFRFEVTPAAGQLAYTGVLADVRHYMMPVRPFTIAVRVLHSARYGADGRDPRLLSNYLGSTYFVRGHRDDIRYCRPDADRVCGDELLGHQMTVGNVEVRVPIWGLRSRQIQYGPVPADAFVFADAGMIRSGTGDQKPGTRAAASISSVGGGFRVSALGFPVEIAATRALDGPRPRWQFDFGFRVGF
ncbi:MAG TPA: BamA/TamA family outer membrane protein [Vicinamibacterales bacterium]|nr:BamA/TamA family outer membrane protein [Vicinamibacterales bacterium]